MAIFPNLENGALAARSESSRLARELTPCGRQLQRAVIDSRRPTYPDEGKGWQSVSLLTLSRWPCPACAASPTGPACFERRSPHLASDSTPGAALRWTPQAP